MKRARIVHLLFAVGLLSVGLVAFVRRAVPSREQIMPRPRFTRLARTQQVRGDKQDSVVTEFLDGRDPEPPFFVASPLAPFTYLPTIADVRNRTIGPLQLSPSDAKALMAPDRFDAWMTAVALRDIHYSILMKSL